MNLIFINFNTKEGDFTIKSEWHPPLYNMFVPLLLSKQFLYQSEKDESKPTFPPPRNNGRTDKRPKDWEKYLNAGYTPSNVNSGLDASDNQRCIQLISKAFHDRWVSPAWTSELREILLSVQFGAGGKVLGYNIIQSSGDPSADRTVLKAASLVHAVRGLSSAFLENNKTVTVRFKVKPQ